MGPSPFESFPPATFDPDDPAEIEMLASLSAPRAHAMGSLGILLAAFSNAEVCTTPEGGGEPVCMPTGNGCPEATETSDGFIVDGGGCTSEDGQTWTGRIIARGFERDADGELSAGSDAEILYESLTLEGPSECPTVTTTTRAIIDGGMTMTAGGPGVVDFELDLEIRGSGVTEDCVDVGMLSGFYQYQGSRREEGTRTIWNGSGRFGNSETGVFEAATDEEVIDSSVCSDEALSGTTTVTAGSDVMVITYDGETDCDETSTATWTYNGADRGEIEGVSCAVSPGSRARPGLALGMLGALLLLGLSRRR